MTENKRFIPIFDGFDKRVVGAKDNGMIISFMDIFDLLNELNDKCEFLEIENESLEDGATKYAELYHQSLKENEQLKQALRELKEIGDYQADRIKELQEFEDKVFDSLNDKIKRGKKAIEWGESSGADTGAMGFHIELLKQFKKELKE